MSTHSNTKHASKQKYILMSQWKSFPLLPIHLLFAYTYQHHSKSISLQSNVFSITIKTISIQSVLKPNTFSYLFLSITKHVCVYFVIDGNGIDVLRFIRKIEKLCSTDTPSSSSIIIIYLTKKHVLVQSTYVRWY